MGIPCMVLWKMSRPCFSLWPISHVCCAHSETTHGDMIRGKITKRGEIVISPLDEWQTDGSGKGRFTESFIGTYTRCKESDGL